MARPLIRLSASAGVPGDACGPGFDKSTEQRPAVVAVSNRLLAFAPRSVYDCLEDCVHQPSTSKQAQGVRVNSQSLSQDS